MIAIKDFEMPKTCYDCPFFHEGWVGRICCITLIHLDYPQYSEERNKNCPLIEVKE